MHRHLNFISNDTPKAPAFSPAPSPAAAAVTEDQSATPWPLLCPTHDCKEHLRAHQHPSAPVLFAACGHSHCGLCAAVVLREPLPQCPTCGAGVGAGQASPNAGLGVYAEAILHASGLPDQARRCSSTTSPADLMCMVCATVDDVDQLATYACSSGTCDNRPLCCDHSRFHARKTGHTPVCIEGSGVSSSSASPECVLHGLPLSHYCMQHSELLCSTCAITQHLSCGTAHVKTVQEAADCFSPTLTDSVASFSACAEDTLLSYSRVTAAKAGMVSRRNASVARFSAQVDAVITALHEHKSRVIAAADAQTAEYAKVLDAQAGSLAVSAEQMRAAVSMATSAVQSASPVRIVQAHASLLQMAVLQERCTYEDPAVVAVVEVRSSVGSLLDKLPTCSDVVTGQGLKVDSVAGLVLEPGNQQELLLELSLATGGAPIWLLDSDLACTVEAVDSETDVSYPPDESSESSGCAVARVLSIRVSATGGVQLEYELLRSDVVEVAIHVTVCGFSLSPDGGWVAQRPHAPLSCVAAGKQVQALPVVAGEKYGMAVSADEQWLVVAQFYEGTVSVYLLPGGELVRTFGSRGRGPLRFGTLYRCCFAPNGNVLLADPDNLWLQEVTLDGVFVRFIGQREWSEAGGYPWCVAVWDDVIAVGCASGTGPRVRLLGFASGAVTSRFGQIGPLPSQMSSSCDSVRFSPDGSHLAVAEVEQKRVSLFTVGGAFVRYIGLGVLSAGNHDVDFSAKGEFVVSDTGNRRVCVFSEDGKRLLRAMSWRCRRRGNGQLGIPTAVAMAGAHLYVLDQHIPVVQVLE